MAHDNGNRRRKRHLCLMLTDGEAEILEARAKARGLKKSAYARDVLFGASAKEAEERAEEQRERAARLEAASADIRSALHELKKQGGNLNQIAYVLNRDGAAGALQSEIQQGIEAVKNSAQGVLSVLEDL